MPKHAAGHGIIDEMEIKTKKCKQTETRLAVVSKRRAFTGAYMIEQSQDSWPVRKILT